MLALDTLAALAPRAEREIGASLPSIVPRVGECLFDTKKEVKKAATLAVTAACAAIANPDIAPCVPKLIDALALPAHTEQALDAMLQTTFVARVDAPTLAIAVPALARGLRDRMDPEPRRKAATIIKNMCRVVADARDVAAFVPKLKPELEKLADGNLKVTLEDALLGEKAGELIDEVVLASREALENLKRAMSTAAEGGLHYAEEGAEEAVKADDVVVLLREALAAELPADVAAPALAAPEGAPALAYAGALAAQLASGQSWGEPDWVACVAPYVADGVFAPSAPEAETADRRRAVALALHASCHAAYYVKPAVEEDEDEGENACDIESFSLAYGGKVLLHNTPMRLKRGHRYGLCGHNGAGKTTLMRSIATGKVEGWPQELVTVFVQSHFDPDEIDEHAPNVLDETCAMPAIVERGVQRDEVIAMLKGVHFDDAKLAMAAHELSGGWRMRLELARGFLLRPDVLLLDEPTNHLDHKSVQWLEDKLNAFHGGTALIVSHDSGFLNHACSDIMHYEKIEGGVGCKLKRYRGNLDAFVLQYPPAKKYYELVNDNLEFMFPRPGRLEGISSSTRAILKLDGVDYTYPGGAAPQIADVRVQVALGSRVAVLGPNGAGKSTLIRMIVGETQPDAGKGEMWKHHNLRVAFVAQHAFHHVEQHLDSSPCAYIQWRFASAVDKELLLTDALKLTPWEEQQLKSPGPGAVEYLGSRRDKGSTVEYEVKWAGRNEKDNT